MPSQTLWLSVATTTIQVTILLFGALKFQSFLAFCQSANASGQFDTIKTILIVLLYSYAPVAAVCVTFSWVAYDQDWTSGNVLIWLPFLPLLLFVVVVLVTKNDISNVVDVQRKARSRLPAQAQPAPFLAVAPSKPDAILTPKRQPALPIQHTPVSPRVHEL